MIQSNELRWGNYFEWSKIASMGIGVDVITEQNHYSYNQLREPITLTDEWLLKLNCPNNFLEKDIDGYFVWFNGKKIYLKYVHELQNLYFALKGNELIPTAA